MPAEDDRDVAAVRTALRAALTIAMKDKDAKAVRVLRTTLGAIDNAEAVAVEPSDGSLVTEGPIAGATMGLGAGEADRRRLTMRDVVEVLEREVAERLAAAAEYQVADRLQQAEKLRAEAAVLAPFLARST